MGSRLKDLLQEPRPQGPNQSKGVIIWSDSERPLETCLLRYFDYRLNPAPELEEHFSTKINSVSQGMQMQGLELKTQENNRGLQKTVSDENFGILSSICSTE